MSARGFHLIEVLAVLSLVAILLSLAIPNYQRYVVTTKRTEAKIMLLRYASSLERYFFLHHTYEGATADDLHLPNHTTDQRYRIVMQGLSDRHYLIKAIAQGVQAKRDQDCATLTLNQAGERGVMGKQDASICWG